MDLRTGVGEMGRGLNTGWNNRKANEITNDCGRLAMMPSPVYSPKWGGDVC